MLSIARLENWHIACSENVQLLVWEVHKLPIWKCSKLPIKKKKKKKVANCLAWNSIPNLALFFDNLEKMGKKPISTDYDRYGCHLSPKKVRTCRGWGNIFWGVIENGGFMNPNFA